MTERLGGDVLLAGSGRGLYEGIPRGAMNLSGGLAMHRLDNNPHQ
jgi:hypothetical protein